MSAAPPPPSTPSPKRAPQVFDASDPALIADPPPLERVMAPMRPRERADSRPHEAGAREPDAAAAPADAPTGEVSRSRWLPGWGVVLISALTALAGLAAGVAFASLVSGVLARSDWVGLVGWGLVGLAALAAVVITAREIIGLMRLGRLADRRLEAERALRTGDAEAERAVVNRLRRALGRRPDLKWAAARFAEHEAGVHDAGDLLRLADRELIAPLDGQARRMILTSAKRVSLVTAMSPVAAIAVGFVLVENLRLLRALATLYGGRPGFLGGMKLARMVFVHILATGGVALTDDLIGQLVGQGLAQRLSRRLGEGLFNGALTARIGVAALDICRPLPFVEAAPVRIRDVLAELARRAPGGSGPGDRAVGQAR